MLALSAMQKKEGDHLMSQRCSKSLTAIEYPSGEPHLKAFMRNAVCRERIR